MGVGAAVDVGEAGHGGGKRIGHLSGSSYPAV
jgi:hypothetical protein